MLRFRINLANNIHFRRLFAFRQDIVLTYLITEYPLGYAKPISRFALMAAGLLKRIGNNFSFHVLNHLGQGPACASGLLNHLQ